MCDKHIYRLPSQIAAGRVFCSSKCVGISQRVNEKVCPVCGINYVGRKNTCSRSCSNKNRAGMSYNKEGDKLYYRREKVLLAEQRGGVCEKCGNSNYNILQVHHIIHKSKGGTDELDNLSLLCPNCHMTEHLGYAEWKAKPIGDGSALEKRRDVKVLGGSTPPPSVL